MAPREAVLGLITMAIALFAISYMAARPKLAKLKDVRQEQARIQEQIRQDNEKIADKKKWSKQYAELSKMMPTLPANKKTDAHWLEIMDNIATRNGVKIFKRQAGEEKKLGNVYELPLECKEWEGTLDSMLHFLFDMQSEGAMLDIRQLMVKPQGKGVLRGRFTLYCAYMREVQKPK
jgi:Tfp pilus assembly protein PilO